MMYQAHIEYKDSEDEWLGDIPSHWDVSRTKFMFSLKKDLVGEKSADFKLLSLTLKGVILRDMESGKGKFPAEFNTYQIVSKNNLIFCLFDIDETPRTIGLSSYNGMITGAYNVYECSNKCVPEFAHYYFLHIDSFKGLRPFYTGLRKVVRADTFANIKMPCPPPLEQKQIVDFIDYETTKIDTLIEKSEQLISLLQEKRQAMISHAVTKGLDPHVPMKDSGIEWLGEIPEHWLASRISYYSDKITQGPNPDYSVGDPSKKYRIMKTKDVYNRIVHYRKADEISKETFLDNRSAILKNEDILMGIVGKGSIGKCNVFIEQPDCKYIFTRALGLIRTSKAKLSPHFLKYVFQSSYGENMINNGIEGSTGQEVLKTSYLASFKISKPTCEEQKKIVEFLDYKTAKLDILIAKSHQQIEKLKEHRSALVSAAVTGKIDVREWNKKEKAA